MQRFPKCSGLAVRVMALLLLLGMSGLPVKATQFNMMMPYHKVVYFHTGTTVTLQASIPNFGTGPTATVDYFRFNVNGQVYDAQTTVDPGNGTITGTYVLNVANDLKPKQYDCYATARLERYYSLRITECSTLDSPSNQSGVQGDGHPFQFILSNFQFEGLTWDSRPCNVYDHVAATTRPNATNPYHYRRTTDANGNSVYDGPYPAVYLKNTSPVVKFEVQPMGGPAPCRVVLTPQFSPAPPGYGSSFNVPFSPAGNIATATLPPL